MAPGATLRLLLAALSLLLGSIAVRSASRRGAAAGVVAGAAAPGGAGPRRRLRSFCHPETAELLQNGSAPLPCSEEQELDSLQDLYMELPDVGDHTQAVIDTSACNATDPEGYTQAVDLFDVGVAEVGARLGVWLGGSWCSSNGQRPGWACPQSWVCRGRQVGCANCAMSQAGLRRSARTTGV
jgi:hypothetical protein